MKYRMTIYPTVEVNNNNYSLCYGYNSVAEMVAPRDAGASLLLFLQDEIGVMEDYSNTFLLEKFVGGGWVEYEEL
jgi:hypothetical protein